MQSSCYVIGAFFFFILPMLHKRFLRWWTFDSVPHCFASDVIEDLFTYFNPKTQTESPMIAPDVHDVIVKNSERLNSAIIYDRDYSYNYFGFKVSQHYENSHVIWDCTVLPATLQRQRSRHNPSQSWYSIYRPRRDERLSCVKGWQF